MVPMKLLLLFQWQWNKLHPIPHGQVMKICLFFYYWMIQNLLFLEILTKGGKGGIKRYIRKMCEDQWCIDIIRVDGLHFSTYTTFFQCVWTIATILAISYYPSAFYSILVKTGISVKLMKDQQHEHLGQSLHNSRHRYS